jgi:hypothetical protein
MVAPSWIDWRREKKGRIESPQNKIISREDDRNKHKLGFVTSRRSPDRMDLQSTPVQKRAEGRKTTGRRTAIGIPAAGDLGGDGGPTPINDVTGRGRRRRWG